MNFKKGYLEKVDERYSLHISKHTKQEFDKILTINLEVHQEDISKTYLTKIFKEYPRLEEIFWLYIQDNEKDIVVSSLWLIPLEILIDDKEITACQMEYVGTIEEYRNRGFVGILNHLYEKVMKKQGFHISIIKGIPYYYRRFGYEFIASLDERIGISSSKIPGKPLPEYSIRKAISTDLDFIKTIYQNFTREYLIKTKFDLDCFKFRNMNTNFDCQLRSTYIIEKDNHPESYFTLGLSYNNECFEISSPHLNNNQMITVLQYIKTLDNYSNQDEIILSINENSSLYRFVLELGGTEISSYGWQLKVPFLVEFLYAIKCLLEKRIQNSEYKNITRVIRMSNYKETFVINFKKGIIKEIISEKGYPNPKEMDLMIPGSFLYKFLLGDKDLDELSYIIKDVRWRVSSKLLLEILFPKKKSLISSYI